jgi:hypothetical protein
VTLFALKARVRTDQWKLCLSVMRCGKHGRHERVAMVTFQAFGTPKSTLLELPLMRIAMTRSAIVWIPARVRLCK